MDVLLQENAVETAFLKINSQLREMGIALETVLKSIYLMIVDIFLPSEQKAFLINRIGDIEYRLSIGCQ